MARVNGTGNIVQDSNITITFTYTPNAAGHLLTCCGSVIDFAGVSDVVSCVDNSATGPNTWTLAKTANSAGNQRSWGAYRENAPGDITSVLVTFSSSSCYEEGSVDEWDSIAASPAFDQSSSNVGARPLNTGNITNTSPGNHLLIAVAASCDDSTGVGWVANGGWTTLFEESDSNAHQAGKGIYKIVTADVGPHSATFDYPPENLQGAALIMSFKSAGAAAAANVGQPWQQQGGMGVRVAM